jgi:hypothetical protein
MTEKAYSLLLGLTEQRHLLVVVLLLFAFELLHSLNHVHLVEALLFVQTVDLAAEGWPGSGVRG